jgi:hypothetical protein
MSPGLRDWRTYHRLAMGYALLGVFEMPENLMLPRAEELSDAHERWSTLARGMACHDLHRAIEHIPVLPQRWDHDPNLYVMATIDVLVAASASGQGDEAYAFAMKEQDVAARAAYLMAVAIGLRQSAQVPTDAPPCWAASLYPQ